MHGEYKVPQGKLVVVDCEVADGRIRNVELSGDFFLHPDEALGAMRRAIEGLPVDTGAAELAERVRAATVGAELLGITPEGVAVAVRRALGQEAAS
jgi:lipoate---protein ligase